MEFGDRPAISRNLLIGIGIVLGLHVLLFYALISGLATSIVDVVRKPLETKIIAAPPPPPPPPPPPIVPPPPVVTAPPPPFIPPPIIQAQHPPPPVFAQVTTTKPTAPPPRAVAPPTPQPKAAPSTSVSAVCRNVSGVAAQLSSDFQDIADQDQVSQADISVEFTVDAAGNVSGAHILSSTFPRLNSAAIRAVAQLACRGQGQTVRIIAPFSFRAG